jgi:putative transposase
MGRTPYPSDLTLEQWAIVEPLIPPALPGGRSRSVDMRAVLNGILYILRTGAQWRALPHDFPPWGTVHYYYRRFRLDGTWWNIHETLHGLVRQKAGRERFASTGIIDSQSVKTTEKGGRVAMTQPKE